jgi:putative ABC transport system ATP-binding protein
MQVNTIAELQGVSKQYDEAGIPALNRVSLKLQAGVLVSLVGRSGSGKSTLLNLLGGLDRPTEGQVVINGQSLNDLSESKLNQWRGTQVGIIFQFFQLLPTLTALENVVLAMDLVGSVPRHARVARATELLASLELQGLEHRLPEQLSGGQQQRVAVARALANDPPLLLADEPTGNLDHAASMNVLDALHTCARRGKAVVLVTHDEEIAAGAGRLIRMLDGGVVHDSGNMEVTT